MDNLPEKTEMKEVRKRKKKRSKMIDDVRNVTSVVVCSITAVSFHDNAASRPTPSSLADAAPTALLQGTAPMPTAQAWAAI